MIHRLLVVLVAGLAAMPSAAAQSRPAVDSLVAQITRTWGDVPTGGWQSEWTVSRGDTTALRCTGAEIAGIDRGGVYTITIRAQRFAAPLLVGRLRIGSDRTVPVAARTVPRGALLAAEDLRLQSMRTWGVADTVVTPTIDRLLGSETRRVMHEAEPVRSADVIAAPIIRVGSTVTAEYVRDGVRLALKGIALQNASLGGRIAIRFDGGRRFAGIATGRNTVRLD